MPIITDFERGRKIADFKRGRKKSFPNNGRSFVQERSERRNAARIGKILRESYEIVLFTLAKGHGRSEKIALKGRQPKILHFGLPPRKFFGEQAQKHTIIVVGNKLVVDGLRANGFDQIDDGGGVDQFAIFEALIQLVALGRLQLFF